MRSMTEREMSVVRMFNTLERLSLVVGYMVAYKESNNPLR